MHQDYIVGEHKADKGKRFLNYLIDIIFLFTLIIFILVILYLIIPNTYDSLFDNDLSINLVSYAVTILYYFLIETTTKGRSIGKFISDTKVVKIDGSEPTTKDYFVRSICRIIPFEPLSFLFGAGFHDTISKTTVVNKKAFEADLLQKDNIESIGTTEIE